MNILLLLLIVGSIGLLVGGVLVGLIIMALRSDREEDISPPPNSVEVVRLWADRSSGDLLPEIKGQRFSSTEEMSAAQRERLIWALEALRSWLGVKAVPSTLSDKKPAQTSAPTSVSSAAARRTAGAEEKAKSPSMNPVELLARGLQTDVRRTSASKSIAAQVDEILQEKLEQEPGEKRAIRLMELPSKGMVVMIGLDQYDGIDAVPDPEVQRLLRECVAEWERRLDE